MNMSVPAGSLPVSEIFYSIQGEGITSGLPAVFVRLGGCNLICGGAGGKLRAAGKASWQCDTEAVWRKWTFTPYADIAKTIMSLGRHPRNLRVVWTGGEPFMHADGIYDTISMLSAHIGRTVNARHQIETKHVRHEIETNGTIYHDALARFIGAHYQQDRSNIITVSFKLANSGMPLKLRRTNAAEMFVQLQKQSNAHIQYKFVVGATTDIEEIRKDWVEYLGIDEDSIVLMPAVDARDDLADKTRMVFDMCKDTGWRACTRLHVLAWDKLTGV